jgi:apolipoprotein N-acyltransferase
MFTLAKETDVPVLTGTLIAGHGEESKHYNGLVMFLPDGTLGGCYRKIQLVPFGEMIPLEDKIPLLARINLGQGDYSPGNELTVFRYKNQKISGVICFESMFPDLFRKFVKRGADFMVVVTNDAWYGRSGAPYHHAAISCMRAAENRVGLARCANTGVSCFIDPTGRLRHPTEIFTRETIEDDLFKVTDRPTFFSLHGDLLSRLILLLSLICIIMVSIKPELFRKTYRDNKIK